MNKQNLGQRTFSSCMQEILSDAVRKHFGWLYAYHDVIVHHYTDTGTGVQVEYEVRYNNLDQCDHQKIKFGRVFLT